MSWTESDLRAYEARHRLRNPTPPPACAEPDTDTPEAEIQDQIEAECRRRGWYVVRSRMDKPTTNGVGTPDLIIAIDCGRTLWVECKHPKRKPTEAQLGRLAWLGKLEQARTVVHSLAEFLEWVEAI